MKSQEERIDTTERILEIDQNFQLLFEMLLNEKADSEPKSETLQANEKP